MNDIVGSVGTFLAVAFFVWVIDGNRKSALRRKYQNKTVMATCEKCRHTYSVPDPWVDDERFFPRKRICPTCTGQVGAGSTVQHATSHSWVGILGMGFFGFNALLLVAYLLTKEPLCLAIFAGEGFLFVLTLMVWVLSKSSSYSRVQIGETSVETKGKGVRPRPDTKKELKKGAKQ